MKSNKGVDKVSILDEVDFELEPIHKGKINVAYILRLLAQYHENDTAKQAEYKKTIINIIAGQEYLRSKRELI